MTMDHPYQLEATEYPDDEAEADTRHLVAVLTEVVNERHRRAPLSEAGALTAEMERIEKELNDAPSAPALRRAWVASAAAMISAIMVHDRRYPTAAPAGTHCQES